MHNIFYKQSNALLYSVIKYLVLVFILIQCSSVFSDFPIVSQVDIKPNDTRLKGPINASKQGELTIASFNIRNLGAKERSLKDIEALVNLVDEADIVVFQEAGLGLFGNNPLKDFKAKRWRVILSTLKIYFGDHWKIVTAKEPSGSGLGRETTIVAFKPDANGYALSVTWDKYIDLGVRRDMAIFNVVLTKTDSTRVQIQLGSVHLKPTDPVRGLEMIEVANWLITQNNPPAIIMGDFNWGYNKTPGIVNYKGENRIISLHNEEKLYQVFNKISYLGNGKENQLRTNMGYRKGRKIYDQILMSPSLANKLADGGKILEDTGFIAFGMYDKRMKKVIETYKKAMLYGLNKYKKELGVPLDSAVLLKTESAITAKANDDATYRLSDHRPIWVQLKFF